MNTVTEDDTPLTAEDYYVRLTVVDSARGKRFLYVSQHEENELTAKLLRAPWDAFYEEVEVWRDKKLLKKGSIHSVGTHASFIAFIFQKDYEKDNNKYPTELLAEDFNVGDEIVIKPNESRSDREYSGWFTDAMWMALTISTANLENAYLTKEEMRQK